MSLLKDKTKKQTPHFLNQIKEKKERKLHISHSLSGILEASMLTLQQGQSLLDRIREMGMHADIQNRHATTAACYGIEHMLELLHDRRRHLEELWARRKLKLEQCLLLCQLDQEVNKVSGAILWKSSSSGGRKVVIF